MLKPAGRRECGRHGDSKDMGGAQGECSAGLPGRSRRRQPIGPAPWLESEASRKATRLLGRKFTSFLFPGQRIIPLSLRFTSAKASFEVAGAEADTSENEVVAPDFANRNPRNLEQLALARKERGWETTWPSREFWRRLRFERTQQYVEAFVEDPRGNIVVSASTQEWAIKRHLYSPKGVVACKNIGRVLAQRCLEAGINFVEFKAVVPWERHYDSFQSFEKAMTDGGVVLREPRRIYQ
ncbi:large ribosomal subunit protein uL18m isoform X1 [Alligator mississippiensis]|uniref:large ribosomal subunit protein uL18m isoform X1 n=1 Tax=Alligator mississippiensis TaxID=8496 RepID=UPI0006ECAC56|nr:large ribosomal subunit protein uL18m isoform X1 [Alligator mississippiensis]